jgi:hypothetical protein
LGLTPGKSASGQEREPTKVRGRPRQPAGRALNSAREPTAELVILFSSRGHLGDGRDETGAETPQAATESGAAPPAPTARALSAQTTGSLATTFRRGQARRLSPNQETRTIMNKLPARILALLALSAAVTIATLAAADTCKTVDITVKNTSGAKIKALKISYACEVDNQTRTESFGNAEVADGATVTVAHNQDLAGCKGYKMKFIKLHYQPFCNGKYTNEKTFSDSSFDDAKCVDGKNYRIDLAPSSNPCL